MNIPLAWLKEYVDITLPLDELCHRLTMAGLETAPAEGEGLVALRHRTAYPRGGISPAHRELEIGGAGFGFQPGAKIKLAMQPAGGRHPVPDGLLIGPRHPSVRLPGARQ